MVQCYSVSIRYLGVLYYSLFVCTLFWYMYYNFIRDYTQVFIQCIKRWARYQWWSTSLNSFVANSSPYTDVVLIGDVVVYCSTGSCCKRWRLSSFQIVEFTGWHLGYYQMIYHLSDIVVISIERMWERVYILGFLWKCWSWSVRGAPFHC